MYARKYMKQLDFPWRIMRSIVGGTSAIDVPNLYVETLQEAESFLDCYGYDWRVPSQRDEIDRLRREALRFIAEELLEDEPELFIPRVVYEEEDARRLLLWASREPGWDRAGLVQRWSCAVLRVMHTFAHGRTHFNTQYSEEIRRQILGRFTPHLFGSSDGLRLGRGPGAIPLAHFEVKHTKPLRSVAMKLLHKPENVATDVFDRVGVRFVTRERFDILRAVHYLRSQSVIMFANVKPSRSRNTVIDLDWLRDQMDALDARVARGELTSRARLESLQDLARSAPAPDDSGAVTSNPFSATAYRAVQFTCRQRIRVEDTSAGEMRELLESARARLPEGDPLIRDLERRSQSTREICFFFPFEIQILDFDSFIESRSGRASHTEYKARQRAAVKRRVLGKILGATEQHAAVFGAVIEA